MPNGHDGREAGKLDTRQILHAFEERFPQFGIQVATLVIVVGNCQVCEDNVVGAEA